MKHWVSMLLALAVATTVAAKDRVTVFIGTQDDAVFAAAFDGERGTLSPAVRAATVQRPTWVATHANGRILYAVSETGNYDEQRGTVHSFRIGKRGRLTPVAKADSGGHGPTYLSHDARTGTLFVANFGKGEVASLAAPADGSLSPPGSIQIDEGRGPHEKQKGPHAHATALDPSGRFVLVPDMGADRIFVYRFDPRTRALSRGDPPSLFTGPGTGPRHLVFSRDGKFVYVTMEHSEEVRVFRWRSERGVLEPLQSLSMDPPTYTGPKRSAEIMRSRDGRFVYASNRGRHTIHVYAVGNDGRLTQVQEVSSLGDTPRSFGLTPDGRWMIVGNQASKTIVVFSVDREEGQLTVVSEPMAVGFRPVAFAFAP